MQVSFKGVNNICIKQGSRKDLPYTVSCVNGQTYNTTADVEQINFTCTLDDKEKQDLNDFYVALAKYKDSRKFTSKADSFDAVNLLFDDIDVKLPGGKQNFKSIKLNNEELNIEDDSILPLYTFLAALTRNISNIDGIDPVPKAWIKKLNSAIHQKACDYLDVQA